MKEIIAKYDSIGEFLSFVNSHSVNSVFRWGCHSGLEDSWHTNFTQTQSYEEACDLLKHGWESGAEKLEERLALNLKTAPQAMTKVKNTFDVVGHQVSVPRHLMGLPTSMVKQTKVPTTKRVITIVRDINYRGGTTPAEIIEYSAKALQVVLALEAQGVRVNLDVIAASVVPEEMMIFRVRIKNAGERLSISKMAFPLAHPSMLRRFEFKHTEVHPDVKSDRWSPSYGMICPPAIIKKHLGKDEYLMPAYAGTVDEILAEWGMKK